MCIMPVFPGLLRNRRSGQGGAHSGTDGRIFVETVGGNSSEEGEKTGGSGAIPAFTGNYCNFYNLWGIMYN